MYVDQHNMLTIMIIILLFPLILHLGYLVLLRLKDILGHILTSVGICQFIIDLISDRILFNILSLKPSEIILGGLIKFKLLSLKKTLLSPQGATIKGNS